LNGKTKRSISYFAQYVIELALETREFELLFGRLEKNAVRRPGVVDKFLSESETQSIISYVAEEIESKGLVEEAIKLFDLCKEHQRVLELCNKLISQVVTDMNTANSNRDRLKSMVFSIAMRYKTEASTSLKAIQPSTISTFYLLTDLMTFFDLFHSDSWDIAYETLNKLDVLPRNSINVENSVRGFISHSEEVKFLNILITKS
jgi:nuclear pore complex protein Nup93